MSSLDTDLIKHFDIIAMAESYRKMLVSIDSIFDNVKIINSYWSTNFSSMTSPLSYEYSITKKHDILKSIKKHAWSHILEKVGIYDYVSTKRRKEIFNSIEANEMPDFTAENINKILYEALANAKNLVQEIAKDVYEYIKPSTGHITNQYSKGAPPKAIVTSVFDNWRLDPIKDPDIRYYDKPKLSDMDKVFHMMDAKGVPHYPNDICTVIENAKGRGECETEYFLFKWFKNGNLHIVFKRMDLVNQLVQLATENTLRS